MFNKMVKYFEINKEKKRIMKIIKDAYGIIFSEKYDLLIKNDVERFKNDIENTCKYQIDIIQAYAIINPLLYDQVSIDDIDLHYYSNLINIVKNKKRNDEILSLEIEMEETKFEINLLIIATHIKNGKKEFKENKYSLGGMIYDMERTKKSPVSKIEKETLIKIYEELVELDEKIRVIEDEQKKYE